METSRHLQNIRPSYIREILSAAKSPDVISLAGGLPATELMPVQLFAKAMHSIVDTPDLFQYGETQGYAPFLKYIDETYNPSTNMESIVCNGSQQGLDLIARAFLNPGDKVIVEAPSYLGALQIFGLSQADILSVNQTSAGPDLNELESLFTSYTPKMFYAVPDFHNPTGVCWSLDVRKGVAKLCRDYGVIFIEDVPYRDLRFTGKTLPLASSFYNEQSIVLHSFSKISAPGIRLGIVSAPSNYLTPMLKVKQVSDLHTSIPMQAALMHVLKDKEFAQHIETICSSYKQRYGELKKALSILEGTGCRFNEVEGGMFVWLKLPNVDSMGLANRLIKRGVAVVPSAVFYHEEQWVSPALRLNFTHSSLANFEVAIAKLAQELKNE